MPSASSCPDVELLIGMGVVYRAHDTLLDLEVALKLVRPREDDEPRPRC